MGKIELNNIRIYAYHGCMIEEEKIGAEYRVDISVKTDLSKSAVSDDLRDTVDYVRLNQIVNSEMKIRSKLVEHVGNRILNKILSELPAVTKVKIKLSKFNPPIGGNVQMATLKMSKKRK